MWKGFLSRWENQALESGCAAAWTDYWRSTGRLILIHTEYCVSHWISIIADYISPASLENLRPDGVVLFAHLTGALFSLFSPFSSRDYKKLPSLFPDMIESRLIDPRSLSPRLEISQRRAARIDTGRSNKAGRLRGHRGVAHTVTPAITTSSPPPKPPNLSVRASRLAWFINNNCNKRGNEQRLHNHSRNVMVCALVVR